MNGQNDNEQQNEHVVMGDQGDNNYSISDDEMVDGIMDDIMNEIAIEMAKDSDATLHDVNNGETDGVE